MKTKILLTFCSFLLFSSICIPALAQGTAFTYQGRLNDSANPANGSYDFKSTLYDADSEGAIVAGPITNNAVGVTNGLFTTTLDFGDSVFSGEARWLQIAVRTNGNAGFTDLAPRQQLTAAPYTIFATSAGSVPGLVVQPNTNGAPNVIAGSPRNFVAGEVVGATISGGGATNYYGSALANSVSADFGTVGGGAWNTAGGREATVSGGWGNKAGSDYGTVGGGVNNSVTEMWATVAGGYANGATAAAATVSGGYANNAGGPHAAIGGGYFNQATNYYAVVPGGYLNVAGGQYSFAAGQRAQALHHGSFVWADAGGPPFASTSSNQFLIRANGGIGIGTNSPQSALHVAGTVTASGFQGPGMMTWQTASGAVQALPNHGYIANDTNLVTITLPTSPNVGDVIRVSGSGTGGWKLAQNLGQSIFAGNLGLPSTDVWTARANYQNWASVASSADGTKLVAAVSSGQLWTSSDSGATWTAHASSQNWLSVASSANGTQLIAAATGGQLWTSGDSGNNWSAHSITTNWTSVASSTDGSKLVATVRGGQVWTSDDSGATWSAHPVSTNLQAVASSADGTKLVAVAGFLGNPGQIWTSVDSGTNWVPHATSQLWFSVASSAEGAKLVAAVLGGQIWTSSDSGLSWTPHATAQAWRSVASSADGAKLAGVVMNGQIWTSSDSGGTWTAHASNQNWLSVASSADGTRLVAAVSSGQVFTSSPTTTPGLQGYLAGIRSSAVEVQYIGNSQFLPLSYAGTFFYQ